MNARELQNLIEATERDLIYGSYTETEFEDAQKTLGELYDQLYQLYKQ